MAAVSRYARRDVGRTGARLGVPQHASPPHPLLALQRAAGNRAITRLLARVRAPADAGDAKRRHEEACQALDQDRRRLRQALSDGKQQNDPMLRNSIEWIERQTLGARLFAVRQTGDSQERAPKGQVAFFPKAADGVEAGHIGDPARPTYNWEDLDDQTGVTFNTPTAGGWNADGRLIAIEVGASAPHEIWKSLKHEVQHAADRNHVEMAALVEASATLGDEAARLDAQTERGEALMGEGVLSLDEDPNAEAAKAKQVKFEQGSELVDNARDAADLLSTQLAKVAAAKAFEHFKTEYRAYSYMGEAAYEKLDLKPGPFTNTYKVGKLEWTPLQWEIVERILGGYPAIAKQFELDALLPDGRRFRAAANAYRMPDEEGYNKLNSVRVNAFYEAVRAIPRGTDDPQAPAVAPLREAMAALTDDEAAYLGNPKEAVAMGKLLTERLAGKALESIREPLWDKVPLLRRYF